MFLRITVLGFALTVGCMTQKGNDSEFRFQDQPNRPVCEEESLRKEISYVSSADQMECEVVKYHCLTKDMSKCPMFARARWIGVKMA